ncbi:hypothetical protein EPN96_12355 [bacterium]|nr:MAG: hypothetical protein EPN96_12355 [bacterium]
MRKIHFISFVMLLLSCSGAYCAEGIKGRASLGGTLVESVDINIYALRAGGFGPFTGDAPAARTKTAIDGRYSVDLPEGRYVVEAIKKGPKNKGEKPEAGDIYCVYSGSPVTVAKNRWTTVGLYLTPVSAEKRGPSEATRIKGRLTFKGEPLEKAYLYGYKSVAGYFHGPADFLQPVARGDFTVSVPAGTYYLVARKRVKGGAYGPIELGDRLNFYAGNPVVIREGEEVNLEIAMAERLSSLEEDESAGKGQKIKLLDPTGKPLASYYVLAYPNPDRNGPPAATSALTDQNGEVFFNLPPNARYLRGRATLGGPLYENEVYVDGEAPQDSPSTGPIILKVQKKK